jgi:hypothetical protein
MSALPFQTHEADGLLPARSGHYYPKDIRFGSRFL